MVLAMQTEPRDLTVRSVLAAAQSRLTGASESPRVDAEVLLEHICGIGRTAALTHPERALDETAAAAFAAAVERRAAGVPVAYITGQREFFSLPLGVSPAVLVPRAETEMLVETAAALIDGRACRVVDLGTGSGAIAIALAHACPSATVTAVDVDPEALATAQKNAEAFDVGIEFVRSDWFSALGDTRFDLIVSNPPYVRSDDAHFGGPLRHEPRLALDGGIDGLDCYRRILGAADRHLSVDGSVVLEHGYDQRNALRALADESGLDVVDALDDLAGQPRVLVLRGRERT